MLLHMDYMGNTLVMSHTLVLILANNKLERDCIGSSPTSMFPHKCAKKFVHSVHTFHNVTRKMNVMNCD